MSPALIGCAVGMAIGLVSFVALWGLADRIAHQQPKSEAPRVLRIVAWVDLVVFPALGWFLGPMVAF